MIPSIFMRPLFHTGDFLADAHVTHGFFTCHGGVSSGLYGTLNCGPGSGDDRANVHENRRRVAAALGVPETPLLSCRQIHGAEVVTVCQPWEMGEAPQADGLVTDMPGIILGVLTADCVPVLFADPEARVIGAAHAGWKGAHRGILEATLEAMLTLGAKRERLIAALGPAIAQSSYEVGKDLRDTLLDETEENARFFLPNAAGRWLFDLKSYAAAKLARDGVKHINVLANDTYSEKEAFFSYRRATKAGESDYGRQVSAIVLN